MSKKGFSHEKNSQETSDCEWYTPAALFEAIGLEFDLDPGHPVGTPLEWVPADRVYTEEDDGLSLPWFGRLWLNAPYRNMELWYAQMARACTGVDVDSGQPYNPEVLDVDGNVIVPRFPRGGIALNFIRSSTDWFQRYATTCDALLLINKRIRFVDRTGQPKKVWKTDKDGNNGAWKLSSPGADSVLLAWGADCVEALQSCGLGQVFVHERWVL